MVRQAQCCCGSVTIEVKGEPVIHAVCHCKNCKARTGSAFGLSAYFNDHQILNITGRTEIYLIQGESNQQRHFCPKCGTTLYWTNDYFINQTGIAGGCFTQNPLGEPNLTVSNSDKYPWINLPDTWTDSLS